jgi:hypothetical protein
MPRIIRQFSVGFLLLLTSAPIFSQPTKTAKPGLWTLDKGLAQPESTYFEPTTQSIYVSNVQGNPAVPSL